jgi:hypothetical protein
MTDLEKIQYKAQLKQFAIALIGARIAAARQAIDQAQQAANSEEKSSAGDKYETGRAMGHLQKDMHSRQMAEQLKERSAMQMIHSDVVYLSVAPGAFIQCRELSFFLLAGMGKQSIEGQTIYFLSPLAPLAKSLHGKKPGDTFVFSGATATILEVY